MNTMRLICAALLLLPAAVQAADPVPVEGNYTVPEFRFDSGETLKDLRLHYITYGTPRRDAAGHVTNAVLILHGTGGSGENFTTPQFAGVLFGPGQLLDANRYYLILPDGIGHGRSSRPSDGLRMKFPHYDYHDMVVAQHQLLTEGLKVDHLRLVTGTSMGCMQSFMWLETWPGFTDAGMPLACLTVEIAGRNRIWRKMAVDAITSDPAWDHGDYKTEPRSLATAMDFLFLAVSSPLELQTDYPTREQADAHLQDWLAQRLPKYDADDLLYQLDASRDYDPSAKLGDIRVPVMWINSADDMVNPPELGIAEREVKKMPRAKFVLLPISPETRGHSTHSLPAVWQRYLAELLAEK